MSQQDSSKEVDGGALLKIVELIAISPQDAIDVVSNHTKKLAQKTFKNEAERRDAVADRIIAHYTHMAGLTGAASGLTGIIPGIGTVVAAAGGAVADAAVSIKLQVDMCMCLASAYGHDVNNEEARHLAFLVASGSALENVGEKAAVQMASKAGVKLVRQYLKGAVLTAIKELFKKLGLHFTRKAFEKAIPFGVGVVLGGSFNYALTRYVGKTAKEWFRIDAEERDA